MLSILVGTCFALNLSKRANENDFCLKIVSYGRGAGTPLKECANGDKDGALCYTPCSEGYRGAGPVCWEGCADGYHDDGAFCRRPWPLNIYAKKSYGRGSGNSLKCSQGTELSSGICYPACKAGYTGVGPVCWKNCPDSFPFVCDMGCAKSKEACDSVTFQHEMVSVFREKCP